MPVGVITIEMSPSIELGSLEIAWHGIMIALGIVAGSWLALRYARERSLDEDRLLTCVFAITVAGIVGARIYYLVEEDPGDLLRPGEWLGNEGFGFYGAMIAGSLAVAAYLWRARLSVRYLDALAAGFPLGMAVGRTGDLINGEHYGPASDAPWAFRYTHPDAVVPSSATGYQSGAFYEILLALAMLAAFWPLRGRFASPGALLAAVVAAYAIGRFLIFFIIRDTEVVALGLRQAQWTSLGLLLLAAIGFWLAVRLHRQRASGIPE